MISSLRLDGCLLLVEDENGDWHEVGDLSQCDPLYNQTGGGDGNQKRCNIATRLVDPYLKDLFYKTLLEYEANQNDSEDLIIALGAVAVTVGGTILTAGVGTISSAIVMAVAYAGKTVVSAGLIGAGIYASVDPTEVLVNVLNETDYVLARNEADIPQFWADVRQMIYCATPANGQITLETMAIYADLIESLTAYPQASKVLATMIRVNNIEAPISVAQFGARLESDLFDCQSTNCIEMCDLILDTEKSPVGSSVIRKANTESTWIVTSAPDENQQHKVVVKSRGSSIPLYLNTINYSGSVVPSVINYELVEPLNDNRTTVIPYTKKDQVENRQFTRLTFYSHQELQMEIDIDDCREEEQEPDSEQPCALFVGETYGESPIPSGTYGAYDNVFVLFDGQRVSDVDGWRTYYLSDADSCCSLIQLPISPADEVPPPDPPEYGILPSEIEYKDCTGSDWLPLSELPKDENAPLNFNAIRFKGSYAIQVALINPAINWPYVSDFADSKNSWVPEDLDGNDTAIYDDGNWRYADVNYEVVNYGRFLSMSVNFATPVFVSEFTINYDFTPTSYPFPNQVIRTFYQGNQTSEARQDNASGTGLSMTVNPNELVDKLNIWFRTSIANNPTDGYAGNIVINSITVNGNGPFPTELT